ncbi:hypothetical protein K432DRAFT_283642, partial [Lepidopterella palustris CBS 459.81]
KKKNLLLAFDAFGTLFTPRAPIATQYGEIARLHGLSGFSDDELKESFRRAFKDESKLHPNYGKVVGLDAEEWWGNVISKTFQPFLKKNQAIPIQLVSDLLTRFSTDQGYSIYPDVLPFFEMLRCHKNIHSARATQKPSWPWDRTVVGVITNSDDRVPGVLSALGLRVGTRKVGNSEQRSTESSVQDDISFVVLSYDVGYEKPDHRIFNAAKKLFEETLAERSMKAEEQFVDDFELLHIGDDVEKDYFGAKNVGWNALVLDR